MVTQIVIQGSPSEQARILKVLQRYGLINDSNEITPSQANSFDTFNKCQEMFNTTLESHYQESNALIKSLGDKAITHAERRRDAEIQNDMLSKSVAAKDGVIGTLRATIKERNRELDETELRAAILEDKLGEANEQLAKKTEQLDAKAAYITATVLANMDDEYRRMVENTKELEENVKELETHQLTLSNKILKLREENRRLQVYNEHRKKRMDLQENRLEKLTKENQLLKRSREGEQVEEGEKAEEIDDEKERLCKRIKLDLN
ncbi:hypothetical protein DL98DRAFT_617264 [Cadophora sp. DSE1049]|nr:hypothetical protein DL98DRAFT_617264 [Cadophora sp. DSE1049]